MCRVRRQNSVPLPVVPSPAGRPLSSRPSHGAKRRREASFWASFPTGGANGEGKKGTRTQAIRPGRPGTPGWSAAVALHYQLGPLEVSAAPRSLLRERDVVLSTRLVGERARAPGGLGVRSPNLNTQGGGLAARWASALAHTLRTKQGHLEVGAETGVPVGERAAGRGR